MEDIKNKKKAIKEIIPDLYDLIGLISVAFEIDEQDEKKYQPWDVVSLSESKLLKHFNHERDKLIRFTSGSFLRIYPKGVRFDSSNYDPVKSWIVGAQLVSLNLQSLYDDNTLINHIFFFNNMERGYVLKPKFLRPDSLENRSYLKPQITIDFSILSGIMLQKCLKELSTGLYITAHVIGTEHDDSNPVLKTDIANENFLHPLFSNNKITFKIYEPELSFIFIKIFDNDGNVLARSVIPLMMMQEGFRNINLYDEFCQEIESSILILRIKKEILI